jgi:hypothetical protein
MGYPTRRALSMLAIAACLTQSPSAAGAFQDTRENPLTTITGLRCRFHVTTSVLWKDGKPDVRSQATESRITIANIDVQDGTAEIPGPRGRRYATTTLSDGSLFVMETAQGALHVTTVFAVESSPGWLKAVHAEYSYVYLTVPPIVPDPTVSQSFGECQPAAGDAALDNR